MQRTILNLGKLVALVAIISGTFARPLYGQAGGPAIGTYPPVLEFGQVARGGVALQDLGLINGTGDEQAFTFEVAGRVARWTSFVQPDKPDVVVKKVAVPALSDGHLGVKIAIPKTVPNGTYRGTVTVFGQVRDPKKVSASPVQVASRAGITVTVAAAQSIAGAFAELSVPRLVEVGQPLRVRSTIKNSGNVSVRPVIELAVLAGSRTVDRARKGDVAVQPRTSATVELAWNTKALTPGGYAARVGVSFGEDFLGTKKATFRVVPRGALGRKGTFADLRVVDGVQRNGLTRIQGTFTNEGKTESRVQLRADVHRDKALVNEVTGDGVVTLPGQTVALSALIPTRETGGYVVVGRAVFDDGSTTASQQIGFDVGSAFPFRPLVVVAAFLVLVAVGILLMRRRRKKSARKRRVGTTRLRGTASMGEPTPARRKESPGGPAPVPRLKREAPEPAGPRQ